MEFKWDGNSPRAFYKMRRALQSCADVDSPEKVNITDTYLDDEKNSLSAQKIALRVRCENKKWEVTFKTKTEIKNGLAVRKEETLKLKNVNNLREALSFLHRKKIWEGIDTSSVFPRFTIKNKRTVFDVKFQKSIAQAACDDFEIFVCGRVVKMKEIELELKKGTLNDLQILAQLITQKSDLKIVKNSKVKTAETLLKLWKL